MCFTTRGVYMAKYVLSFNATTQEATRLLCRSCHYSSHPATPLLELFLGLGRKVPEQLLPCLIVYFSIFDLKWYISVCLFETLITLTSEWQHYPEIKATIAGSFSSLRLFFADIKYYINLAKENLLKALKIIHGEFKTIAIFTIVISLE